MKVHLDEIANFPANLPTMCYPANTAVCSLSYIEAYISFSSSRLTFEA